MEAYLGGVLESLKAFYVQSPAAPVKKFAPVVPKKSAPNPSSAKTSKPSRKKKTI